MRVIVNSRGIALQSVDRVTDNGLEEITVAGPFFAVGHLAHAWFAVGTESNTAQHKEAQMIFRQSGEDSHFGSESAMVGKHIRARTETNVAWISIFCMAIPTVFIPRENQLRRCISIIFWRSCRYIGRKSTRSQENDAKKSRANRCCQRDK